MATGKIIYIRQGDKGVVGYVSDDAIKGFCSGEAVYFDSRCFEASAEIGLGDRVSFEYDIDGCRRDKPRMKFDSMKLI